MYELNQITERCYYIQSPAKIGLVRLEGDDVALIDSGNDRDAGKKVLKILDAHGWRLKAVYTTHAHADHIGGNRFLQEKTGCEIYAPGMECFVASAPVLEPVSLFGANPPRELRHKFLMAQESQVEPLTDSALPKGWTVLPLAGHSMDMVGYLVDGKVAYLADCLCASHTLAKYGVPFIYDVGAYLASLERVKALKAAWYVPSHADVTEDIVPLAEENIVHVHATADRLTEMLRTPMGMDDLIRQVFRAYGLQMTFEQHALVGSTVRSYLTYLENEDRAEAFISDDRLMWRARGEEGA